MALVQFGRRSRFAYRIIKRLPTVLLLIFIALSIWEYRQSEEVTWITRLFQTVERTTLELAQKYTALLPTGVEYGSKIRPPEFAPPEDVSEKGAQQSFDFSGRVIKIKDGDSLVVRSEGKYFELRLHGIDAPEWKQPYGEQAKRKLASLVLYREIQIRIVTVDSYDRMVSAIYANGKNINLEMVKTGHAWWYRHYASSDKELKQAEATAKVDKLGLWGGSDPIPPWEWRRAH